MSLLLLYVIVSSSLCDCFFGVLLSLLLQCVVVASVCRFASVCCCCFSVSLLFQCVVVASVCCCCFSVLLLLQCVVVVLVCRDWQRDVWHCRNGNNNSTFTCTRSRRRCFHPGHHTECSAISRHPLQLMQTIIANYIVIYYRVTVVVHFIQFVEQNKRLSVKTLLS